MGKNSFLQVIKSMASIVKNLPAGKHITPMGTEIISVGVQNQTAGKHMTQMGIEIVPVGVQIIAAGASLCIKLDVWDQLQK